MSSPYSATSSLERFTALSAEWMNIEQRARASEIAHWSEAVAAMTEQAAEAVGAGRWRTGPADLLGVSGRDRDELTHSRMLAWVLNPLGQHGLGPSLLEAFVRRLDPRRRDLGGDLHQARVRLEVTRAESRADIVVDLARGGIVIENKIDAVEQPDQCLRQANDYQRHVLVFLTPHGYPPTTAGPSIGTAARRGDI